MRLLAILSRSSIQMENWSEADKLALWQKSVAEDKRKRGGNEIMGKRMTMAEEAEEVPPKMNNPSAKDVQRGKRRMDGRHLAADEWDKCGRDPFFVIITQ